jgi:epoxyqueuosine reductase
MSHLVGKAAGVTEKSLLKPSHARQIEDTKPQPGQSIGLTPGQVRAWALEAGFSDAGIVSLPHAAEARDAARFNEWIAAGKAGKMGYLERTAEDGQLLRARVRTPFPWARSAIVCFASYHTDQPRSTDPAPAGAGWIARYAWSSRNDLQLGRRPSDYHKVLLKRLKALEARIRRELPDIAREAFTARAFVDTGPVVERSLAVAAGLGWTGKNTCLIHPKLGSYGFLAVLLTSLELEKGPLSAQLPTAQVPDRCGSCRRCLEACPTGALIAPYQMDARRCISYLTIEHKGVIADDLMAGMGRQVFGCDICQDVCPWNRKAPIGADAELETRAELVNPALEGLASMDEAEFERRFNGSPVRRAGFRGMLRNVAIAIGNSGQRNWLAWLEDHQDAEEDGLRKAVRWALQKLRGTSPEAPHS